MIDDSQRRGIDDASRLTHLTRARGLTPFEREMLEAMRLLTQRVGEVASALERMVQP